MSHGARSGGEVDDPAVPVDVLARDRRVVYAVTCVARAVTTGREGRLLDRRFASGSRVGETAMPSDHPPVRDLAAPPASDREGAHRGRARNAHRPCGSLAGLVRHGEHSDR